MTSTSGADLLARIKPKLAESTARICLRPDLLDAWQDANERLIALRSQRPTADGEGAPPGTLSTNKATKAERELAEQIEALEAEIGDSEVEFRFRGMTKDRFQALCDQHPPRKGNQYDLMMGYNGRAVDSAAVRECMIEPTFADCDTPGCEHTECGSWQQFISICNPSEWEALREACSKANGSVTAPPKSPLAAQVLRRGGTASK